MELLWRLLCGWVFIWIYIGVGVCCWRWLRFRFLLRGFFLNWFPDAFEAQRTPVPAPAMPAKADPVAWATPVCLPAVLAQAVAATDAAACCTLPVPTHAFRHQQEAMAAMHVSDGL